MKNKVSILSILLFLLSIFLFLLNTYSAIHYSLLGNNNIQYVYLGVNIFILLLMLIFILIKKLKKTTILILVLYSIAHIFIFTNIIKAVNIFDTLNNNALTSEYTMSIAVKADSTIESVKELTGKKIQAPLDLDKSNIDSILTDAKKHHHVDFKLENGASYNSNLDNLLRGDTDAIILNSSYEKLIEVKNPEYSEKIKKIYEFKIKKDNAELLFNPNKKIGDSFNIYVSGIDIYGPITTVSRSDVNIIVTVNTKTKKVLLTTIPRDSYVRIADGGNNQYDKLTHAGLYGVNSSVHTLENLLGIKIDYYARVNFSRFMNIVDYIGGIEVYNEQAFKSYHGNYYFPVGMVKLDSEKALGYVRERYSFEHGDVDRAKNQQKVLSELIKKITKIKALSNYEEIIYEITSSTQTNMPIDVIMSLVNKKFDGNKEFVIDNNRVEGVLTKGLKSYAMPDDKLNMVVLSKDSTSKAHKRIEDIINGR